MFSFISAFGKIQNVFREVLVNSQFSVLNYNKHKSQYKFKKDLYKKDEQEVRGLLTCRSKRRGKLRALLQRRRRVRPVGNRRVEKLQPRRRRRRASRGRELVCGRLCTLGSPKSPVAATTQKSRSLPPPFPIRTASSVC